MIVWSAVPTFFFFMAFKRLSILRVGEVVELVGMDYLERDQSVKTEITENFEKTFLFDDIKLRKLCRLQRVERLKNLIE